MQDTYFVFWWINFKFVKYMLQDSNQIKNRKLELQKIKSKLLKNKTSFWSI